MKIEQVIVPDAAYAVYDHISASAYWNYVNIYGKCYNCDGELLPLGDWLYAKVQLEGGSVGDARALAESWNPFDLRTFDMVKEGCCPKGLTSGMLQEDAE